MSPTSKPVVAGTTIALAFLSAPVLAAPITYDGTLSPGVPFPGVNMQSPGNHNNPVGANYISFFANAGATVTLFGDRQAGHYDMSFWVFQGLFTDTNQFAGGSLTGFDASDPGFIAFGDDQDPPNIPGPHGDPRVTFTAPVTGFYTIAVTNFSSSANPPNPFTLTGLNISQAPDIPEPGSLAMFGMAAVVAGGYAWRRLRHR